MTEFPSPLSRAAGLGGGLGAGGLSAGRRLRPADQPEVQQQEIQTCRYLMMSLVLQVQTLTRP